MAVYDAAGKLWAVAATDERARVDAVASYLAIWAPAEVPEKYMGEEGAANLREWATALIGARIIVEANNLHDLRAGLAAIAWESLEAADAILDELRATG